MNKLKVVSKCGKFRGCDISIYVLPHAGTREEFEREVRRVTEETKKELSKPLKQAA